MAVFKLTAEDRSAAPGDGATGAPGAFMQRQIGHLLRRAYARARSESAAALLEIGELSPVQASAIAALMEGQLTQADLGRRIGMEPANTHTLVRRLAAAGLVDINTDPGNRRLSLVALSARGSELSERLEAVLKDAAAATLAPLDHAERLQLISLLNRIVHAEG